MSNGIWAVVVLFLPLCCRFLWKEWNAEKKRHSHYKPVNGREESSRKPMVTQAGMAYINSSAYLLEMTGMAGQFWALEKDFYELLVKLTAMHLSQTERTKVDPRAFKAFVEENLVTIRAAIDRLKKSQPAIGISEEDWERARQ